MHQFEETGFRAQGTQPSITPKLRPLPPYRHAGRLVQHYHGVIFKQDLALQTLDAAKVGRGQFVLFGNPHGGTRTSSPVQSLYSGLMRFLLTRTSLLRRMR
jgi:hypothetical protein